MNLFLTLIIAHNLACTLEDVSRIRPDVVSADGKRNNFFAEDWRCAHYLYSSVFLGSPGTETRYKKMNYEEVVRNMNVFTSMAENFPNFGAFFVYAYCFHSNIGPLEYESRRCDELLSWESLKDKDWLYLLAVLEIDYYPKLIYVLAQKITFNSLNEYYGDEEHLVLTSVHKPHNHYISHNLDIIFKSNTRSWRQYAYLSTDSTTRRWSSYLVEVEVIKSKEYKPYHHLYLEASKANSEVGISIVSSLYNSADVLLIATERLSNSDTTDAEYEWYLEMMKATIANELNKNLNTVQTKFFNSLLTLCNKYDTARQNKHELEPIFDSLLRDKLNHPAAIYIVISKANFGENHSLFLRAYVENNLEEMSMVYNDSIDYKVRSTKNSKRTPLVKRSDCKGRLLCAPSFNS